MILAVDPGTTRSAFVLASDDCIPIEFAKVDNDDVVLAMRRNAHLINAIVIENVTSYGQRVGEEVFATCRWIGRFEGHAIGLNVPCTLIPRKEVKKHICGTQHSNDSTVRKKLIERFAKFDTENGKGTKQNPDWFYGFKADVWQAYALAVCFLDKRGDQS